MSQVGCGNWGFSSVFFVGFDGSDRCFLHQLSVSLPKMAKPLLSGPLEKVVLKFNHTKSYQIIPNQRSSPSFGNKVNYMKNSRNPGSPQSLPLTRWSSSTPRAQTRVEKVGCLSSLSKLVEQSCSGERITMETLSMHSRHRSRPWHRARARVSSLMATLRIPSFMKVSSYKNEQKPKKTL